MRNAGTVRDARAADRRGLGHELVRLHEDARRARLGPAQEARRRSRARRATSTRSAASGSASARPDEVAMSLRTCARLLAVAYVLLLVIVALAIPLAAEPRRGAIESEVQARARRPAPRWSRRAPPDGSTAPGSSSCAIAKRAATDLGGRVIDPRRRGPPLADSAGPAGRTTPTSAGPRWRAALAGSRVQGSATATRSTRTCCTWPCRCSTRASGRRSAADAERRRRQLDASGATRLALGGRRRRRAAPRAGRGLAARGHAGPAAAAAGRHGPPASPTATSRRAHREGAEEQRALAEAFNLMADLWSRS